MKVIIKYNPKPFFNNLLQNNPQRKKIEDFTKDLVVEFYNRKNFQNVKYYNMSTFVKVEMDYE